MNLNEVVNYTNRDDEAAAWAVFHEFKLRQQRWELVREDGMIGSYFHFVGDVRRYDAT